MDHPAKTFIADRVLFFKTEEPTQPHVAFVIKVVSDHHADLLYWNFAAKAWQEAYNVVFGKGNGYGTYFVNSEA